MEVENEEQAATPIVAGGMYRREHNGTIEHAQVIACRSRADGTHMKFTFKRHGFVEEEMTSPEQIHDWVYVYGSGDTSMAPARTRGRPRKE